MMSHVWWQGRVTHWSRSGICNKFVRTLFNTMSAAWMPSLNEWMWLKPPGKRPQILSSKASRYWLILSLWPAFMGAPSNPLCKPFHW